MLGEGGFVVPTNDWFSEIAAICHEKGILIIADEIQTGFGRTGSTFSCQQLGLVPDLLACAKSIAAGLPLAAVTGRAEVIHAPGPGGVGGTFGENPVACEAGLANWDSCLYDRSLRFHQSPSTNGTLSASPAAGYEHAEPDQVASCVGGNPNRIMQSLIAVLTGLQVPFLCSETHEWGEKLVASYLYQVHLYHWLETNNYGRFITDNAF